MIGCVTMICRRTCTTSLFDRSLNGICHLFGTAFNGEDHICFYRRSLPCPFLLVVSKIALQDRSPTQRPYVECGVGMHVKLETIPREHVQGRPRITVAVFEG